jgi:myosin-15
VEVVFNQIAPDYLEGLLLIMPGEQLDQDVIVSFHHFVLV